MPTRQRPLEHYTDQVLLDELALRERAAQAAAAIHHPPHAVAAALRHHNATDAVAAHHVRAARYHREQDERWLDTRPSRARVPALRGQPTRLLISELRARCRPYGLETGDDRKDVGDPAVVDAARQAAGAVAILVHERDLKERDAESLDLVSVPLSTRYELCSGEAFQSQPTVPGYAGTGFLLGRADRLITCGHVVNVYELAEYRAVFGFQLGPQQANVGMIRRSNVRKIRSVHRHAALDVVAITLDAEVEGVTPLSLALQRARAGTRVYTIGHPVGLPVKIADNALVTSAPDDSAWFNATLDAYKGNSGSPVLDANTHEVVGLAARGAVPFIFDGPEARRCRRSMMCSPNGSIGVDCLHIDTIE